MPQVFDSIHDAMARIVQDVTPNPLGVESDRDTYEWVDFDDDDGGRIMPSWTAPFASPFLYRGQSSRWRPCVPSLYRFKGRTVLAKHPQLLDESERDLVLFRQCWLTEFKEVLEGHPAIAHARQIGLHLSRDALAQHYGIPTEHLDLTADQNVAAFFATCKYDAATEVWHPVSDEGNGVIYRFDLTAFPRVLGDACNLQDFFHVVEMIGLQTLPRPGEQKAWSFHLPLGMDFENLPLDAYEFRQSKAAAQHYSDMFQSGISLFPPDILANKADEIKNGGIVPRAILETVLRAHDCRSDRLDQAVEFYSARFASLGELATRVCDIGTRHFAPTEVAQAQVDVDARAPAFLKKVGVRPVKLIGAPALTAELKRSKRPQVRSLAARQLGDLGTAAREAIPALRKAQDDPNPEVREAARAALKRIENAGAEP